ncbi:nucleoside-diphosphate sugar epimerase/dehydratase [Listeria sp. PSOL-1]|uniref:polysaccharide biosynthesis protein n=1 Tax=Listeria sp. PSOL-1 TaxID=1844999 RepID=UPI0013D07877|nr:nucleoside-diphosphate sugar epimerase/dehydratase [Listeria sp. PSOL-1]
MSGLAKTKVNKTLIVGAGSTGKLVASKLSEERNCASKPVAFIDDDHEKKEMTLVGLPIVGPIDHIDEAIKAHAITEVIIAIPSLSMNKRKFILKAVQKNKIYCKEVPNITDLLLKKKEIFDFQSISFEALLNRAPVQLDTDSITKEVKRKTILVTGAGGSIGSEICRQLICHQPKKIILMGHGENSIYEINQELQMLNTSVELIPFIADIKDKKKMILLMDQYKPEIVYHAAAHKHVPLMEHNPHEAVMNNIIGTKNIGEAAKLAGVDSFVMISSDKAVNPTNVMGATKRLCEMVIQQLAKFSDTKFSSVRFGNVLGSRGSVIPLFRKQIMNGGPITLTDPRMTRFFMTIPEAASLVLQAGSLSKGGEIFVLDMGESVKIIDIAKNLIFLSGYTLEEIPIQYTGIRDGEKLYEELLLDNEIQENRVHPKIFIGKAEYSDYKELARVIQNFELWSPQKLKKILLELANQVGEASAKEPIL